MVVSIDVAIGDVVEAGQTVITLEAMKMNTIVSAPSAGTVSAIHVSASEAVEEGQAMVTLA
jgi:biotin carboxyl carrier protein